MATISAEVVEARIKEYGRLWTIDDLIRVRAQDKIQSPILGYPRHASKPTDYEYFTGKDLDRMVDETCHLLVRAGFKMNSYETVALFAQSDLSFIVTFFALFRLGCKVLIMSIRLGEPACLNLLATAECDTILYGTTARIKATIADLKGVNSSLNFMPIPGRDTFDRPNQSPPEPFFRPIADKEVEHIQVSLIAHSSGSTGLPKPLFLSHRSIISTVPTGTGLRAFNALPWYHIHGLFTSLMAMWMRQPAHMFNALLPLTAENLILALKEARPDICHCVPYTLKLMAEREDGINVLRRCRYVTSTGARTPDDLGDKLVKARVKLGVIYGMTEVGHVGDSIYREPGDDSWVYVRPYANLRPHMIFKRRSGNGNVNDGDSTNGVYEAVYLKSHPALKMSNSDDPPGSFHSRDLWRPHPTLPDAWKYVARDDDTVTLLSGEKILPLGIEGAIRESPLVRDALVVGNDRLMPGVLVFRAPAAEVPLLSDEQLVDAIWSHVQAGNRLADEFARITRDMIVPVPADIDYPATDKNNIIRGAAYAQFQNYIDAMYSEKPQRQGDGHKMPLKKGLSVLELEGLIQDALRDQAGIDIQDIQADFFGAGLDSLRAAQIRRLLLQKVDLAGHSLPTNAVYDAGNISVLARRLHVMSSGSELTNSNITDCSGAAYEKPNESHNIPLMRRLIDEYGTFERRNPGILPQPERETVILTGATGALGAHILHQLLQDPQVENIYCLVRSSSNSSTDAASRVQASLRERRLSTTTSFPLFLKSGKLVALPTNDLSAPNLGLSSPALFAVLQDITTLIVHAAWPVNFNIGLASFRPQLAGLRRLLDLAAEVPFRRPARLLFTSSISAAFGMPVGSTVPEGPISELGYAAPTGYARSKLVGERICERAAAAAAAAAVAETIVGVGSEVTEPTDSGNEAGGVAANSFLSVFRFMLGWGVNPPNAVADARSATDTLSHVAVLRVGQISADTEHGIWNAKEAIPMMVRSAAQVGALPRLEERQGQMQGRCEWMPVDTAARAILELAAHMKHNSPVSSEPRQYSAPTSSLLITVVRSILGWPSRNESLTRILPISAPSSPASPTSPFSPSYYSHWWGGFKTKEGSEIDLEKGRTPVANQMNDSCASESAAATFYNLVAPHHFSWNDHFLPAVRASGLLRFDVVDLPEWLARLRARAIELGAGAEALLPAIQLAEYYEEKYVDAEERESGDAEKGRGGPRLGRRQSLRTQQDYADLSQGCRGWTGAQDGAELARG
ncbi:NRPS-like protein biosynthetic cluster [Apiospora kogelbergensis]|uniref:NRPS-like protein biosynthetic cluster n=1 Tax=Apiospora kogelbergensis TaxID=1337665 RepID=A0AAW0QJC5_9PEZI